MYILSSMSGFTDFAFPLLALYGKQHLDAMAGFAYLICLTYQIEIISPPEIELFHRR
jgi:hypothetical protein